VGVGIDDDEVSLMMTAVGSTEDVADVASVDDDDTGAGAGVADETGAWRTSEMVVGVETAEEVILATMFEVDVEYDRPVWST
jgi:hypothetical protein